jgi:hypothetical protein
MSGRRLMSDQDAMNGLGVNMGMGHGLESRYLPLMVTVASESRTHRGILLISVSSDESSP